jgi:phosphoglycerate dehydrogenase-like enzyme
MAQPRPRHIGHERAGAGVTTGPGGPGASGGAPRTSGPGSGPGGAPLAIALSPILAARYRSRDLDRIRAAAPGARLVSLSIEGLADAPLDEVEVLLRGWLSADAFERILARAPRLSWVHSASAGVERALTPAAIERGIVITNARGVFSRPIAEYVLMMILAVSRRLPQLLELQRERTWQPLEGAELRDVTVGIVGLGSIGRAVGALATAFGCRVIASRRTAGAGGRLTGDDADADGGDAAGASLGEVMLERVLGPEGLPELLGESDFVVLAAPLTPETEGMIGATALASMKPGAWLINVARGRLVDERALLRALREGHIGGAVLDTFVEEPLGPSSEFYDLPNVIVTPHTSWSSGRVLDRSVELFCDNLRRFAMGEPLVNVVDPAAGY